MQYRSRGPALDVCWGYWKTARQTSSHSRPNSVKKFSSKPTTPQHPIVMHISPIIFLESRHGLGLFTISTLTSSKRLDTRILYSCSNSSKRLISNSTLSSPRNELQSGKLLAAVFHPEITSIAYSYVSKSRPTTLLVISWSGNSGELVHLLLCGTYGVTSIRFWLGMRWPLAPAKTRLLLGLWERAFDDV